MRAGTMRSRARIHRISSATDEFRQVEKKYSVVGETWMEVRPLKILSESYGAGEQAEGTMEGEMHAQTDLRERDVLEIYAGPLSGTKWRVAGLPYTSGRGELFAPLKATGEKLS